MMFFFFWGVLLFDGWYVVGIDCGGCCFCWFYVVLVVLLDCGFLFVGGNLYLGVLVDGINCSDGIVFVVVFLVV